MILDQWGSVITDFKKQDGRILIENRQDCGTVVDMNKHAQGERLPDTPGLGKLVARIPVVLYYQWLEEDGITVQKWAEMGKGEKMAFIKRKLNDPDYAYLKTKTGRV